MWDVFANQSENFDSFASHSLLSLPFGQEYRFFRTPTKPGTSLHTQHFNFRMSWRATSLFPLKSDIVSRPKDKLERLK